MNIYYILLINLVKADRSSGWFVAGERGALLRAAEGSPCPQAAVLSPRQHLYATAGGAGLATAPWYVTVVLGTAQPIAGASSQSDPALLQYTTIGIHDCLTLSILATGGYDTVPWLMLRRL